MFIKLEIYTKVNVIKFHFIKKTQNIYITFSGFYFNLEACLLFQASKDSSYNLLIKANFALIEER